MLPNILTPTTTRRNMRAPMEARPAWRTDFDRLFDDMLTAPLSGLAGSAAATSGIDVDVSEDENSVTVRADVPGVKPEDLNLSIEDNALVLSGEKHEEHTDNGSRARVVERRYGTFQRIVPLPAEVDENGIDATVDNGVLTVTAPKKAEDERRGHRIQIRSKN